MKCLSFADSIRLEIVPTKFLVPICLYFKICIYKSTCAISETKIAQVPNSGTYRCAAPIFYAYFSINSFLILLKALNFSEISIDFGFIVNGFSKVIK